MISTSSVAEKNASGLKPMQIDAARYKPLLQGEKDQRHQEGLCFYCSKSKHKLLECLIKPNKIEGSKCNFNGEWNIGKWRCLVTIGTMKLDATKSKDKGLFVSSNPTPCSIFHVHIKTSDCEFFSEALLDIGASICFMDKDFTLKHSLELIGKVHPIPVEVIDGQPLA